MVSLRMGAVAYKQHPPYVNTNMFMMRIVILNKNSFHGME